MSEGEKLQPSKVTGDAGPDELIRVKAALSQLTAAADELRQAFLDGCGQATRGPKRKRLVAAGAAVDAAILNAREVL